jgi:hypothetical protein
MAELSNDFAAAFGRNPDIGDACSCRHWQRRHKSLQGCRRWDCSQSVCGFRVLEGQLGKGFAMTPGNPHHHRHAVDAASAFVFGLWALMFVSFAAILRDCSAVLTDLPHR